MSSVLTTGANTLSQSIDRVTNSFENFKTQTQSFQGNLDDVSKGLDKVDDQQVETNKKWKVLPTPKKEGYEFKTEWESNTNRFGEKTDYKRYYLADMISENMEHITQM